jgi:hypothetical protein
MTRDAFSMLRTQYVETNSEPCEIRPERREKFASRFGLSSAVWPKKHGNPEHFEAFLGLSLSDLM